MGKWMILAVLLLTEIHSAFPCAYFFGSDFSNQTLVIMTERDHYCDLDKTTTIGDTVTCKSNVTATRLNDTCVLLNTEEGADVTFFMNYGRDNELGKYAHAHHTGCPALLANQKTTLEPGRSHYGVWAAGILVIIIIIIIIIGFITFLIYKNRRRSEPQINGTGGSSVSNGSAAVNMVDINREP